MKRLVPYFSPVVVSVVLGGAILTAADAARGWFWSEPTPTDLTVLVEGGVLGVALAAVVALVMSVILVLMLPIVRAAARRIGRACDSEEEFIRSLTHVIVAPSGSGLSSVLATAAPFIVGLMLVPVSSLIVPRLELTNVYNTVAFAVWATFAFVGPLFLLRLAGWRWPRARPRAGALWALVAVWANYITAAFWTSASPHTIVGSLPLMMLPAAASVFAWRGVGPRSRRALTGATAAVLLASLFVLATYPKRSAAHASLVTGPVVALAAWDALAWMSDLDGDGATSFIGGSDCAPLDYDQRPSSIEVVGNGIDDNCFGGELESFDATRAEARPTSMTPKPPVIFITVDTLRADTLGQTVKGRQVTPVMDAFMEGAVSFTNAYSTAAGTDESIPALMTGMYPSDWHQYGVYFGVEPTLAELLVDNGYGSHAIVLLPWLRIALVHGFDIVDNSLGERHYRDESELTSAATTQLGLEALDARDPDRPFLLWVHFYDVHLPRPLIPELKPWLGKDEYLHHAHLVDRAIGDFIEGVDERGLLDKAVMVLVADHGEANGEHGLQTHGWNVWESIVRVPMGLRLPGIRPRQIDEPVSIVDVTPTLLDYLRYEGVDGRDGRSLIPLILGKEIDPRPVFIEAQIDDNPGFFSIVDRNLKLTVDIRRSAYHLYDVEADPQERDNLIESRPEDAQRLLERLGKWRDAVFNDRRVDRKRELWEQRSQWEPQKLITHQEAWQNEGEIDPDG